MLLNAGANKRIKNKKRENATTVAAGKTEVLEALAQHKETSGWARGLF